MADAASKTAVTSPLSDMLRRRIKQQGPITIAQWMTECLAHPEHGYYMTRDPFGEGGDFTTAPEISQMFGEMLAACLIDGWERMGAPAAFYLVECGPGRGTLMADMLRIARKVRPEFVEASEIVLIDISPVLKRKQQDALSHENVIWLEDIGQLSSDKPLFLVANEFLDALPIHQFIKQGQRWQEIVVGWSESEGFHPGRADIRDDFLPFMPDAGNGTIFEVSPARDDFTRQLSDRIKAQTGLALLIDYGHEVTSVGDTFQAMRGHDYVSVFDSPGEVDLTSHVDFASLVSVCDQGLCYGPVTQGAFLNALGISMRAAMLKQNDPDVDKALYRLTADEEMGGLFRVLALSTFRPAGL